MKKLFLIFLIIFSTFFNSSCVLKDITVNLCEALAVIDFDKFELIVDSLDKPELYKDMVFIDEFRMLNEAGFFEEFSPEGKFKFVKAFNRKELNQIKKNIVKYCLLKEKKGLFLRDAFILERTKTIGILNDCGAGINLIKISVSDPKEYWYLLHYAAMYNLIYVAKFLISKMKNPFKGFDIPLVDLRDVRGNTPLHFAAMRGKIEMVELLLENGADLFIENKQKETPLDKAKQCSQKEMIELLGEAEIFKSMRLMFEGADFDDDFDSDSDSFSISSYENSESESSD